MLSSPGNFRKLLTYQKAEIIYDITFYFCHKYLRVGDRTIDQMVQAARSGKQNIVEGCKFSLTSSEIEIKLINVAKSSLQELMMDYEDYLRTRKHRQWEENSVEITKMRELLRNKRYGTDFYMKIVETRPPETIANIVISMIKQNDYLLHKQLETLEKDFLENGGLREKMSRMRLEHRKKN